MKRLSFLLLPLSILSLFSQAAPVPQDCYLFSAFQNDRAFLLDYYRKTTDNLQQHIEGLTTAQLQYKPSAEEWSISQCLEHIIATEKMLLAMAKEMLEKPANPERKAEIKITDQQVIDGITDRSYKAKASTELIGEGRYTDPDIALADFRTQRMETLTFIENISMDDLRNRISDLPTGPSDGYHFMLFIAGHTARHTLQIEEVKAKEGFPTAVPVP